MRTEGEGRFATNGIQLPLVQFQYTFLRARQTPHFEHYEGKSLALVLFRLHQDQFFQTSEGIKVVGREKISISKDVNDKAKQYSKHFEGGKDRKKETAYIENTSSSRYLFIYLVMIIWVGDYIAIYLIASYDKSDICWRYSSPIGYYGYI